MKNKQNIKQLNKFSMDYLTCIMYQTQRHASRENTGAMISTNLHYQRKTGEKMN